MWDEIEKRIQENEANPADIVPLRRALFNAMQESELIPGDVATKKMVSLRSPGGSLLLWEIEKPASNLFLDAVLADRARSEGFEPVLRKFDHSKSDGGRHSALSREWSFGSSDCIAVRLDSADDLVRIVRVLNDGESRFPSISRAAIESAMDAFDRFRANGDHSDAFAGYGEPSSYWVRSTKERPDRKYPSKPIVGSILKKRAPSVNGGWGQPNDAAARLHAAGYIIVDKNDVPLPLPEQYGHLMSGADRARLVAMNYFVAPAREAAQRQVTIRASDLHDMSGLIQNWANVCQALEGEKFQTLADVGPPARSGPVRSSTTEYTFALTQDENQHPMVDSIAPISPATNLILYGPPGTGKTYTSAAEAVRLCGEKVSETRAELMADYLKLVAAGRIEFVTFHQSMSYEEFIEGRQPTTGGDEDEVAESAGFRLETVQGIFKRIAKRAETSWGRPASHTAIKVDGRQVFKMSIGQASNPDYAHLFEEAVDGGYTLLGFADIDWSDDRYSSRDAIFEACKAQLGEYPDLNSLSGFVQMPFRFRNGVRKGDIIIVSKGNKHFRAIGEVTGDYEFHPRPEGDYGHRRAVRWLWIDRGGIPVNEIYRRGFHQQSIYLLPSNELNVPALERYMNSQITDGANQPDQFVLIIDEINRANISKVFGELITLLEPDKRLTQINELRVRLPYSGDEFGVPPNLNVVGTMNTADRSIALLDTALRRRFTFKEMMPDPTVLRKAAGSCGVDLPRLLKTINERIEYLYDREHQIGHAYFTACHSKSDVDQVMRNKVIPLLAEYFFEDWAKIAAVLGDLEPHEGPTSGGFLNRTLLKAPPGLEDVEATPRFRWQVRSESDGFSYANLEGA